ncbi:MAG: hypothetical protein HYS21_09725 [Deltaproteobacteria bacterium]|nr:hypothetical protein [Deltaproteobacteria bacterium]
MSNDIIKNIIDTNSYIHNWLTDKPVKPKEEKLSEDPQKRFDTILTALLKETDKNVLRFKPRKK